MGPFYVLLLPSLGFLILFSYVPMYGVLIAFKDYMFSLGVLGSPWNGFAHFRRLFLDPFFHRVFFNTFYLSVLRIIFGFPAPVLLALVLNEIRCSAFKKTIQTISYLPHFVSWVVLATILGEILSPQRGIAGYICELLGREPINLLTRASTFRGLLVATGIWQSVGWGSIIYLAALSSVDPAHYESASIDGANRLQKAVHISLPSLVPAMSILLLLSLGNVLRDSFDQIFNLYSPVVYEVADVFSTYIYRMGIEQAVYDYTTAIGLFQNVVGVAILLTANTVMRRLTEYAIW